MATRRRAPRRPILTPEALTAAEKAARAGLTNEEIAEYLGISQRSFYRWRAAGDAHLSAIRDAHAEGDPAPKLSEHDQACAALAEAIAGGRARVYEEIASTALQEALGGGKDVTVREKIERIEIDGEVQEVVVERIVTTSHRAPNTQLLALILTRRFRHAWGTDAMPITPPDSGERDAVQALMEEAEVRDAFHAFEDAIGRAQEGHTERDTDPDEPQDGKRQRG